MKCARGLALRVNMYIPLHVNRDALADVFASPYSVNALLHFAMMTVGLLHSIGNGRQQGIIQEGERIFKVGREEFLQGFSQSWEMTHSAA